MKVIVPSVLAGLTVAALATLAPAAHADSTSTVTVRQGDFIAALSDTRTTGHVEFLADGLHVWTDGVPASASTNKAAEYVAVTPQAIPTSASLTWYGTSPQPGSQIVFDANGATAGDEYNLLVGEPVYGDQYWLTNGSSADAKFAAPSCDGTAAVKTETSDQLINEGHCTGGNGSAWHGTLAQWKSALGAAQVYAAGFSLGSGVQGDGVLRGIQLGDTDYRFTSEPALTPVAVTGSETATPVVHKNRTVVKVHYVTDTLGANQVQAGQLRFKVIADGKVVHRTRMGAGEKTTLQLSFARGTGKHVVELFKNGLLEQTVKVKTGH